MEFKIDDDYFLKRLIEVMETYPFPDTKIPLCLDVGANVGAFSLVFSYYCDKVISLEPFKENYDYMVSMIDKHSIDNIIPINKAIYPSDGEMVEMSVVKENTDSKDITCVEKKPGMVSLGSVETISLESIIKEYGEIDYMKVDCEGCEYDLLYNTDLSKIKSIVTEVHGGFIGRDNKVKLIQYLNEEYDVTYEYHQEYSPNDFEPTEFVFRRKNTTNYENNIFIRFATHNPNVLATSPEFPNRFSNFVNTCSLFVKQPNS